MKKSIVVFLCIFDMVGKGIFRLTYPRYSPELNERLNDGAEIIIYNMKQGNEAESEGLRNLFLYAMTNVPQDDLTKEIHKMIEELKKDSVAYTRYLMDEFDREFDKALAFQKGEQRGVQKGERRGNRIGMKRGVHKGQRQEAKRMAALLKKDGYPLDRIAVISNLSIEEVAAL